MSMLNVLGQRFEHLSVNAAMWFIVGMGVLAFLSIAFTVTALTIEIRDYLTSRGEEK